MSLESITPTDNLESLLDPLDISPQTNGTLADPWPAAVGPDAIPRPRSYGGASAAPALKISELNGHPVFEYSGSDCASRVPITIPAPWTRTFVLNVRSLTGRCVLAKNLQKVDPTIGGGLLNEQGLISFTGGFEALFFCEGWTLIHFTLNADNTFDYSVNNGAWQHVAGSSSADLENADFSWEDPYSADMQLAFGAVHSAAIPTADRKAFLQGVLDYFAITQKTTVFVDSDSISLTGAGGWVDSCRQTMGNPYEFDSFSYGGRTLDNIIAEFPGNLDADKATTRSIYICWEYINQSNTGDTAASLAGKIRGRCEAARAIGCKILVANDFHLQGVCQAAGTIIESTWEEFADAFVDLNLQSIRDTCADDIHPSQVGADIIAGLMQPGIESITFSSAAPTVASATINAAGTTLTLVFSQSVTGVSASDYHLSGRTLSYAMGSGDTWTFTISPAVYDGDVRTLSYDGTATLGTGDVPLDVFSGASVTNNSTQQAPDPGASQFNIDEINAIAVQLGLPGGYTLNAEGLSAIAAELTGEDFSSHYNIDALNAIAGHYIGSTQSFRYNIDALNAIVADLTGEASNETMTISALRAWRAVL